MTVLLRALALIGCACSACSYPEFAFTPKDTGAIAATAVVDAGAHDTNVAIDTSIDSESPDTRPVDTGVTPDVMTESGPTVGCPSATSVFCDDFEGIVAPAARWDSGDGVGSGSLSLVATASYSPTQSLLAQLAAGTANPAYAKVGKVFTAPTAGAVTRMEARLFFVDATYPGQKAIVMKTQQTGGRGVGLLTTDAGFGVEVYGSSAYTIDALPATALPSGKWLHVRIEFALRTTGGFYRVFIDNMAAPVAEKLAISTSNVDDVAREFTVGLYTENPTTAEYRVRFDDVRLDFLP